MNRQAKTGFTLLELLVVMAIVSILIVLAVPAFNGIKESSRMTRAVNDVSGILELARSEAMATRSYVYVGFANTTNSDGSAELRIGVVISMDGSSSATPPNLRPISKLVRLPNVQMTNYTNLPSIVKSSADISLITDSDYVVTFAATDYLKNKFNDSSFDSCPTVRFSPQGDILNDTMPTVFFRTTTSVGLVPTHGTALMTNDGAIVSYYGGTGQLRITRPRA